MSPDAWFAHVQAISDGSTEVVHFDSYREAVTFVAGHLGDAAVTVELFDFLGHAVRGTGISHNDTTTPHLPGFYRWDSVAECMVAAP